MDKELQEYIDKAISNALRNVTEVKAPSPRLLEPTHHKWFRHKDVATQKSKMAEAFNGQGYISYAIWDAIRPTVMRICGKRYVRDADPKDAEKINEIADKLCQCVYDLRAEWQEYEGNNENHRDDGING